MRTCILSSGSKGNATYLEAGENKILIDVGNSCLYIEKKLMEIGVDSNDINAIFITHTHTDHIEGLKMFLKKHHPIVYLSIKAYEEISLTINLKDYYIITEQTIVNSTIIDFIKTSHDTSDSLGYIFCNDNTSLVYITDTGYINSKYYNKLSNRSFYIMESNHDVDLLMHCRYPYQIKQRILGDKGHLSNKDSAYYLSKFIGDNTKTIVLAHLSEENNNPELAYETLSHTLHTINKDNVEIIVAKQNERTELMEV